MVRREAEEDWGALDLPPEMFYRLCRRLPNNTQAICGSSTRTSPVLVGKLAKPVPDIVGHSENVRHLVRREHGLDQQHVLAEQVLLRAAPCERLEGCLYGTTLPKFGWRQASSTTVLGGALMGLPSINSPRLLM